MPDVSLEPQLDWTDIQGNIIAGFNKDHQTLLGYRFGADRTATKQLVAALANRTTDLMTVQN